jgi:YVTN family beta-propeller protein
MSDSERISHFIALTRSLDEELGAAMTAFPAADCVRLPFHSAFRPLTTEEPTDAQRPAMNWRNRLAVRNDELRTYFTIKLRAQILELLPLIGYGAVVNFGYDITAERARDILRREIIVLEQEKEHMRSQGPNSLEGLLTVVRESIRQVPRNVYAFGVLGVVAAASASILVAGGNWLFAVAGGVAMLAGMVVLRIFSDHPVHSGSQTHHQSRPALVLTWCCLLAFVIVLGLLVGRFALLLFPPNTPVKATDPPRADIAPNIPRKHESQYIYVANETYVLILDTAAQFEVPRIEIPSGRHAGIAITPDGRYLFVPNEPTDTLSIVDLKGQRLLKSVSLGERHHVAMAVQKDGQLVYITGAEGTVIKARFTVPDNLDIITTIPVGKNPSGIALTPDERYAYVSNWDDNSVSVIDTVHGITVQTITEGIGAAPSAVVMSEHCSCVYVPSYKSGTMAVINIKTNKVGPVISLARGSLGAGMTPDGRHLYVASDGSSNVEVVDTSKNQIEDRIGTGRNPSSIGITSDGSHVYVACRDDSVWLIDTSTHHATPVADKLRAPFGIVLGPVTAHP